MVARRPASRSNRDSRLEAFSVDGEGGLHGTYVVEGDGARDITRWACSSGQMEMDRWRSVVSSRRGLSPSRETRLAEGTGAPLSLSVPGSTAAILSSGGCFARTPHRQLDTQHYCGVKGRSTPSKRSQRRQALSRFRKGAQRLRPSAADRARRAFVEAVCSALCLPQLANSDRALETTHEGG
ncbi:hypothetical protein PtA15_6A191 [Puccinia triticina]|uniref:Uncharacterized protein n=1 Tax=Puccinia triticina TaxID=208348 RepID=A0ABY7CKW2_9BASI|nr:uncharacterized protein PtA15_6A191 [Puccinia triticina]WAQ85563.1 hypothetical protein PtA15_6A191 [Puccinia triticina]WAR55445.1 hypothetical protein PtB15_6B186 [Puccinia triticina]